MTVRTPSLLVLDDDRALSPDKPPPPPLPPPPSPPPSTPTGGVIHVRPGDNLLSVIEQAPAGVVLSIDPAVVAEHLAFTFLRPITLQNALPLAPGRVTDDLIGPTLRGAWTCGAPDIRCIGIRFQGLVRDTTILTTGQATMLDRVVVLGTSAGQRRGVAVNSADVRIAKSHIANIWHTSDAQAVAGWDGTRHLRIDDCYLEASGENVMFGGADAASADRIPSDIIIGWSTLAKPVSWLSRADVVVKNLLELKNVRHFRAHHCEMQHCWKSGQDGYAIVLTVRNQEGGNPFATIEDVLIEDNTIRHVAAGFNILGRDNLHPSGRMFNVVIRRNAFESVDAWLWGGAGRQVQISGGPRDLTIDENTFAGQGFNSALTFDQSQHRCDGLRITGNRFHEGEYGIKADALPLGVAVLDAYAPGYVWERNTIVKGPSGRTIPYPPGTTLIG